MSQCTRADRYSRYNWTKACPSAAQTGRIATVRHAAVLEGREGIRKAQTIKLSQHIKAYVAQTEKASRATDWRLDFNPEWLNASATSRMTISTKAGTLAS